MMSKVRDGVYGVIVGDVLGVPVEFMRREVLQENPVIGPREYGSHNQPLGAWSDDTLLTLALADALGDGYELKRIAETILDWWLKKKYTSHGYLFDIGQRTLLSMNQLLRIMESGDYEALEYLHLEAPEHTNGNGSLMKILPLYFVLKEEGLEAQFEKIRHVSALTHPHIRSAIACLLYLVMIDELMKQGDIAKAYQATVTRMDYFFATHEEANSEREHFARILSGELASLEMSDIKSDGYVIHTLEASLWSLLSTSSYADAVLTAINLGYDTDTIGAVTGGIAGIQYGLSAIPQTWLTVVPMQQEVNGICARLPE
jgi:ADP-ribosyl-[dinitrogen reductase] hydrolase